MEKEEEEEEDDPGAEVERNPDGKKTHYP